MKVVQCFEAEDGAKFEDEHKCIAYEQMCMRIKRIMARLPAVDIHGDGFVQLDGLVVLGVQRDLVLLYEELLPDMADKHTEFARNSTIPVGMSLIGRCIDDSGPVPLQKAWRRIQRIDNQFREYEQPYYAMKANRHVASGS